MDNKKYIKEITDKMLDLIKELDEESLFEFNIIVDELLNERTEMFGENPDFVSMNIKNKIYPGMYVYILFTVDMITTKRWEYWSDALYKNNISKDIPQVNFDNVMTSKGNEVKKMLRSCIDVPHVSKATSFNNFINYLLYCLTPLSYYEGDNIEQQQDQAQKRISGIDDKSLNNYYENFCLEAMMLYPGDYLGDLAAEYLGDNGTDYFPTPHHVVDLMLRITMSDDDKDKNKTKVVCDPCAGSSRMLLYASNYSLCLYSQDISQIMVNVSTVNGFLYMPWMVCNTKEMRELLTELEHS